MKFLTYIFFSIYIVFAFSPLFPFVEYVAKYDYIISEKCENKDKPEMHCNGKCHLKKQIEKTKPEKKGPQEAEAFDYYEIMQLPNEFENLNFENVAEDRLYGIVNMPSTLEGFERSLLHPPRC